MVDTQDLKSCGPIGSCGFESHPRHRAFLRGVAQLVAHTLWEREVGGSSPPTPTNLNIANFAGSHLVPKNR